MGRLHSSPADTQETSLLSRFVLSRWLTALVTIGALIATLVNLVITSYTAPLAQRIEDVDSRVHAMDVKIDANDKDTKDWMIRIENKIDRILLK